MLMETKDRIEHFEKEEQERIKAFAKELKNMLQLFDPGKIPTRNTSTYNRETLRTYLKNPATDSNNKNLRKLSNYLYTISHVYRRMINYKAHQINCKTWSAYPIISMIEDNDEESILREYERVVNIVANMHMETQIYKLMLQAWKNGITYGYVYGDPEKDGSFYIHLLDPDYCKVNCASFDSGVLGFLFDMSYFNGREDELVFYDITASSDGRKLFTDILTETASKVFIPLTVGGGINTLDDFDRVLKCGADKVSVNSGAIKNPRLIGEAAKKYGNQCVVLSADIKRVGGEFHVFSKGGRIDTGMEAIEWIKRGVSLGAGEVVVNSIDTDGVKQGFDLELLRLVCEAVDVPVIASGGAGKSEDFTKLFQTLPKVDAGLAASIFHFGEVKISDLKQELYTNGIPVRR